MCPNCIKIKIIKSWEEGKKKRTSYHRRQGDAGWYKYIPIKQRIFRAISIPCVVVIHIPIHSN